MPRCFGDDEPELDADVLDPAELAEERAMEEMGEFDVWHDVDRRNQGPMDDASEEDFERWAEAYDDLNGAPENDDDR
jgi:hypothetical protein